MLAKNFKGLRGVSPGRKNRLLKYEVVQYSPSHPIFTREALECGDTDVLPTFPRSKPFPVPRSLRRETVEESLVVAAVPEALISDLHLPTLKPVYTLDEPTVRPTPFDPVNRLYVRQPWPLNNPRWNPTTEPQCLTRSELKAYRQDLIRDDILTAIVIERKLTMPQYGRMSFVVKHILETSSDYKKADKARSLRHLMDLCVKGFFVDFNWIAAGRALRAAVRSKKTCD